MVGALGAQPLDKPGWRDAELIADPALKSASGRPDGMGGFGARSIWANAAPAGDRPVRNDHPGHVERDPGITATEFAGAYLRFKGDVGIEHRHDGEVSHASGQTLWELLYFGGRPGAPEVEAELVIGHQA